MKINSNNIKKSFIRKNFRVFFLSFVVPVLLAGMIILSISTITTIKNVDNDLGQSLNFIRNNVDSINGDSQKVYLYAESTNFSILNRMLNQGSISYADSLAIHQFQAFIQSFVNSDLYAESVYLYIDNPNKRLLSSLSGFITFDSMIDKNWMDYLINMNKGESTFKVRENRNFMFEQEQSILSSFYGFSNYRGGVVINYNLAKLKTLFDTTKKVSGQIIALVNNEGEVLVCTTNYANNYLNIEDVKRNYRFYQYEQLRTNDLMIISWIPRSSIFNLLIQNFGFLIIIVILLTIISIVVSYFISYGNYKQLKYIDAVFSSIDKGEPHRYIKPLPNDLYSRILQNLINVFLKNNYLKMQLSEKQYKQRVAELQALQYQINPHFLNNVLQTIDYQILDISGGKYTKANKMIENLSDIIRYSLTDSENRVQLSDEINNCKKYISIQQIRYQNNFMVRWDIEPELFSLKVPCLILQPLIENAIVHGIRHKKKNALICVSVKKEDQYAKFSISDNGNGITKDELAKLRQKMTMDDVDFTSTQVGLVNCNQRLILSYSNNSAIDIVSRESKGTHVSFKINLP